MLLSPNRQDIKLFAIHTKIKKKGTEKLWQLRQYRGVKTNAGEMFRLT